MALSRAVLIATGALCLAGSALGLTADEVTKKTGVAGGFCVLPRLSLGDEALAIELARRPCFVVHASSNDEKAVASLRAKAQAAGLLGRSLYVERLPAGRLPFADRLADLVIVDGLRDADLTPELRSEWLRVLGPRRGAALVGRSTSLGAGLSEGALRSWSKGLPLAKVAAEAAGVWAVLRKEMPAGSDSWSHRCGGPDNSQVSADATLAAPLLPQWWGLPRVEGFWGTTVVSEHGRMFVVRANRSEFVPFASSDPVMITARGLNNGVLLWQRPLRPSGDSRKPHGGYIPGRSCLAAAGDVLYVIDRDGVLRLDAETGADLGRIAGPRKDGSVKWIAAAGGRLAVLAGDADAVTNIRYQVVSDNPNGRDLAVYETATGKELWREDAGGAVDERLIAARDGKLYYLAAGKGVVCRDLGTGKVSWTNSDAELQKAFAPPPTKTMGELLYSMPGLMVLDEVVLLRCLWQSRTDEAVATVSRVDGKTLWRKPRTHAANRRAVQSVAVKGLWVGSDGAVDLVTGRKAEGPEFIGSGCGPSTATPRYLISGWGGVEDLATGKLVRRADTKAPCDIGSFVSEGVLVTVPSQCTCNVEMKGYRALASAGSYRTDAIPAWKDRLEVLDAAEPAAMPLAAADWPTYRHDPQRSAGSPAKVADSPRLLWQWKPEGASPKALSADPLLAPDFVATAPVAAAGKVWFGAPDGTVRCVEAASGKEAWSFPTGGRLFAPPTVWEGRVLAGGADGRIYSLDATTGKCLWRVLAGPGDRRIFWFGHLAGTWPLTGGVVVHDGVGYAVAGYQRDAGIHACAFDPKTGRLVWEQHGASAGGPLLANGCANLGNLAVGAGRLWLSSGTSTPAGFDLADGKWKPVTRGGHYGDEIAVLGDWVLRGGERMSTTQNRLGRPGADGGMFGASFVPYPDTGVRFNNSSLLAAWDAELCAIAPLDSLAAVETPKLLDWMLAKAVPRPKLPRPLPEATKRNWTADSSWSTKEVVMRLGIVLAGNQVVVAYRSGGPGTGKLSGFSRKDGAKLWTVDLPEQPVSNALAVDRGGRVIVSLCDGSVVCVGK